MASKTRGGGLQDVADVTRRKDDLGRRNLAPSPATAMALTDAIRDTYGAGYSYQIYSAGIESGPYNLRKSGRHVPSKQGLKTAIDVRIYDPRGREVTGPELFPLAEKWVSDFGSVGIPMNGRSMLHVDLTRPSKSARVWSYGNLAPSVERKLEALAGTGPAYQQWGDPHKVIAQRLGLPETATVQDVQNAIGVSADGTYGPQTFAALQIALNNAQPAPASSDIYANIPIPAEKPAGAQTALAPTQNPETPFDALLRDSTALSPVVPPNPDAPRLDAYQSGYGNPAPAMAAPVSPVQRGGPLGPAAFGGDPILANAGGFVSPLGDMVTNPDGLPDPNMMPSENMPFVPLGDPSKGNVVTGLAEGGGMQLAPLDSAYPVTPGDPLASLTPEQAQIAAENYRAEQGFDLGPQNGRPNNAPQSNDDPLRGALTQMAAESTNIPVPTPRPSIEPVPQERPALYASGADIPIPVDRPQTQTAGAPVNAPTTDPWTGMRASADPLSSLVSSYAPIDPMITGGFAQNLAYAQANPSQIDVDPALMDPALGAPVDPLAPAVKAPVQPLTPPVEVRAYPVKEAAPEARQAQKWNVPSGMDVWQGASNYGRATDGSTLSRNPDGSVSRYSEKYDRWDTYNPQTDMWTPGGDDPLAGALGGMGLSKGGLSSDGKQTSNIKNILKGALVGGKVGGLPGAAVGALVGGNAQNIANQGGFLSKAVGAMFGVQSDPYASLERQARQAAGGKFQSGSSNPSDYSYSPAAHDAIAAGKGGLF